MKTAEEHLKSMTAWRASDFNAVVTLQRIKQIQLEGVKEGMRRAANKIRREIESCGCNGIDRNGCESCNAKENSRIDILTAAEQLTEKDL